MATLLTGASGFLGAHTLTALLAAGDRVRAFVRTPSKLDAALSPLGVSVDDDRIEVVQGDMVDGESVGRAAEGCDSVVHAAATYSFKRRDTERMERENEQGTEVVLRSALGAGAKHVVHVSSTVALTRPGGHVLDGSSPLGGGVGPYSRSKVASERAARTLQDDGAPVSIVNPGVVIGPNDPYLGVSDEIVQQVLQGRLPVWPRGALQWVDVRDTAAVIVAVLGHGPGGRWLVPGEVVTRPHDQLSEVTGRRLRAPVLPAGMVAAFATPGDLTGWSLLPSGVEGVRIIGCANTVDASKTTQRLGVAGRQLTESLRDTVRWLVEAGHISRKQAGKAAP